MIEPGDAPGRLTVLAVDAAQQPLPAACFAVVELGFEVCDDDGDGAVVFDAVPSAPLTLRETTPPSGFASIGDLPISIEPTGARLLVPHQPVVGETPVVPADVPPPLEPAETPQAAAGEGDVVLTLRNRQGNPVPGGCWALSESDANQTVERCDGDDGAGDGIIHFDTVPAGRYRLHEVTTPTGYQPADNQRIDVVAGAPTEITVEYQQARGRPGRLIVLVADEKGDPVPRHASTCRARRADRGVRPSGRRATQRPGSSRRYEYTVIQTRTAEGFTPADKTSVVVPEADTIEFPLVNAHTDRGAKTRPRQGGKTESPVDEGGVIVSIHNEDAEPLPGACVALDNGSSVKTVCDDTADDESGDAGQIEISAVAPGDYTLTVTPPDGFEAPSPTTIQVAAGPSAPIDVVLSMVESAPENGSLAILAEELEGAESFAGGLLHRRDSAGRQAFGPFCDEDGDGEVLCKESRPVRSQSWNQPHLPIPIRRIPFDKRSRSSPGKKRQVIFRHGPATQEQESAGTLVIFVENEDGEADRRVLLHPPGRNRGPCRAADRRLRPRR